MDDTIRFSNIAMGLALPDHVRIFRFPFFFQQNVNAFGCSEPNDFRQS